MQRQKALLLLRVLLDSKPQLLLTLGEKKVLQTIDRVIEKMSQEGNDNQYAELSKFIEGFLASMQYSVERVISTLAIDLHKHTTMDRSNNGVKSTDHAIKIVLPRALRLLLQLLNCSSFQPCSLNPHVVSHISIFLDVCQLQASESDDRTMDTRVAEGGIPDESYELVMLTVETLCNERCVQFLIHKSKTSRLVLEQQLLPSIVNMLQSEKREMRIHCLQMLSQIVPVCIEEGARIKGNSEDKRQWEQAIYQFVLKKILFRHGDKLLSDHAPIPRQILQLLCLLARVCPQLVGDMAEMLPGILGHFDANARLGGGFQTDLHMRGKQFSVHAIFLVQAILEWCVCGFESSSSDQQALKRKCLYELQALGTGNRIVDNMTFSLETASTDSLFPLLEIMHDVLTALQKSQDSGSSAANVNVNAALSNFCKPFCHSVKTLVSLLGDDGLDAADSIVATRQLRDLASKILLQLLSMFCDVTLTEIFPIDDRFTFRRMHLCPLPLHYVRVLRSPLNTSPTFLFI
jgi:hypothetical protein